MGASTAGSAAPAAESKVAGAVIRAYLRELEQAQLKDRVRSRVSGPLAAYFESPPGIVTWVPAELLVELVRAIGAELGRAGLRDMAFNMTRNGPGQIALPVLRTVLSLSGATPNGGFKRVDTIVAVQLKGSRFTYVEEGPRAGIIKLESPYDMDDLYCASWEGAFLFMYELCGVKGDARTVSISPDKRVAEFRVSW